MARKTKGNVAGTVFNEALGEGTATIQVFNTDLIHENRIYVFFYTNEG